ncbi:M48 family metallopeptidase [Myxococcota bacterium]|nr:M48 family metallopeptidase [Myxococcota bacterium]
MIEGLFFDGARSAALPARIELVSREIVRVTIESGVDPAREGAAPETGERIAADRVVGPADGTIEVRRWEGRLADVSITERIGNIPRRVTIPDLGVFETRDNDAIDRALSAIGRPFELVHWLEDRWPVAIAALVAVALGSFLFVRFGVPAIADFAAQTLPPSVDRVIGTRTLELLDDRLLHPSELPKERQDELRRRFEAMTTDARAGVEEHLELRAAPALGPNAFALPSGIVVLTDELVGIAEHDDELVAVLAHELGHVRGRHALRRLFQSIGVSALAFALVGDISSASALFGAVPALIEAKHSRDFEREADGFARAWLVRQGIPPFRFDEILCRMEGETAGKGEEEEAEVDADTKADPGTDEASDADRAADRERARVRRFDLYFSTHPTTDERARCTTRAVPSDQRAEVRQQMREDVSRKGHDGLNAPASPRTAPPPAPAAPGS